MNERHYYSKPAHYQVYTGGFAFCERVEATKLKLNNLIGPDRSCTVEDAARALLRSDALGGARIEQLDEFRRVDLGKYE